MACLVVNFVITEKYNLKYYWLIPYVFSNTFLYLLEIMFTINCCPPFDFPTDPDFSGDEFEVDPVENRAHWSFARKHFAVSFSLQNLFLTLAFIIFGTKATSLNDFYVGIIMYLLCFRFLSATTIPIYLGFKKCCKCS